MTMIERGLSSFHSDQFTMMAVGRFTLFATSLGSECHGPVMSTSLVEWALRAAGSEKHREFLLFKGSKG